MVTITMVALAGREAQTLQTIERLNAEGGMRQFRFTLFYFAANDAHKELALPSNCVLQRFPYVDMLTDFWRMVAAVPEDEDWVFLEDDIWPCRNAMTKIATVEVPRDVGLLSFFDMRNQFPSPGIWRDVPAPAQHLWGSQCVKFPAWVLPKLKEYAREKKDPIRGWDTWVGRAVNDMGYQVAHYAPSLVQHVGMVSIAYANVPHDGRPITRNFPGEDFDALGACSDPIIPGPWTGGRWRPENDEHWCALHRRIHPRGNYCPRLRKPVLMVG